jgi:hypothetical protein
MLGIVYLAAFLSLAVQIHGLIGSRGILPVQEWLPAVQRAVGAEGYYLAPTLCWLNAGDGFLTFLCLGGAGLACLLIIGVAPAIVLFLLWVFYLSLVVAGQVFLGYQWDSLLLEAGFLAIFLAPPQLWPRLGREAAPSLVILFLFRWLLFRLTFMSGVVKLQSGDPTWRNLTALHYHYETQPLPAWTSWYVFQMPDWFQRASVVFTFAMELLVPIFFLLPFLPRWFWYIGCAGTVLLQLVIAATGNYGFFNLLTVALAVLLLDDTVFPRRWRAAIGPPQPEGRAWTWPGWITGSLAVLVLVLTLLPVFQLPFLRPQPQGVVARILDVVYSLRSFNQYGLFAVMTTRRPEIIVEGSEDGETWLPYEFKWKPGDVARRPRFTGLHMPRLDWQMWFAALGSFRQNPWFLHFLNRLQEGSPEVLALLERNPFADHPPRYVRAMVYDYHFTDTAERRDTGAWWRREWLGLYCPVLAANESR